ncbi:hypothetical protein V8F20_007381 [Naviculisporaceae sp. PSN 640]
MISSIYFISRSVRNSTCTIPGNSAIMRGFSTTALLLAAALGRRTVALDQLASSSASADLVDNTQTAPIVTQELDTTNSLVHTQTSDEIVLEDDFPAEWEDNWFTQSTDDDLEYLQIIVERLQAEIDTRRSQLREAEKTSGSRLESVFHKIVHFLTSFGGETEVTGSGKGGWHRPKFPFPPHRGQDGRGNHTQGNHTWPPHHGKGNHTHHGRGNHTHGNHTHPPHHWPPFRLPPHFCRPPHHRPPYHEPHPPKEPDDGSPVLASQAPNSVLSSLLTALNQPLFQITVTPGAVILTFALCFMFIRMFRRIRAVALRRKYQRRRRLTETGEEKLSLPMPVSVSAPRPRTPPPEYYEHDHGNVDQDGRDGYICRDTRPVSGEWQRDEHQYYGEEEYEYDEKEALMETEVINEKESYDEEEELMSMSEEIASFRSVADLVSDMVAAEEGRAVGERK